MSDFCFHFASLYLERGYSVIPLLDGKPAIEWKPFQERRATLPEIAVWFGAAAPKRFEIGIVTGSVSDLVVVSVEQDIIPNFDSPLIAQVRSGYTDMYFRMRQQSIKTDGQSQFDLYSEDGFILAPDSPDQWVSWLDPYDAEKVPRFESAWVTLAAAWEKAS